MAAHLLIIAALANVAFSFLNTAPLVAWSSSSSNALDSLPSRLENDIHSALLVENILDSDDICKHDAVVIIEQPGLHASDLRQLSPSAHISKCLSSSLSARQFPYIPAHSMLDMTLLTQAVSSRCNFRHMHYSAGSNIDFEYSSKHVISITLPHLVEFGKERLEAMSLHESLLADSLSSISDIFPDHLVIYTGSSLRKYGRRQAPDVTTRPSLSDNFNLSDSSISVFAPSSNTTLPQGGILKKYQLLTPALITSLLVAFFILIPVVLLGMKALASIQNPLRIDVSKSFNAQERKNQ